MLWHRLMGCLFLMLANMLYLFIELTVDICSFFCMSAGCHHSFISCTPHYLLSSKLEPLRNIKAVHIIPNSETYHLCQFYWTRILGCAILARPRQSILAHLLQGSPQAKAIAGGWPGGSRIK